MYSLNVDQALILGGLVADGRVLEHVLEKGISGGLAVSAGSIRTKLPHVDAHGESLGGDWKTAPGTIFLLDDDKSVVDFGRSDRQSWFGHDSPLVEVSGTILN